jgi:hypothetical protein
MKQDFWEDWLLCGRTKQFAGLRQPDMPVYEAAQ